jgi:hypothetical protein
VLVRQTCLQRCQAGRKLRPPLAGALPLPLPRASTHAHTHAHTQPPHPPRQTPPPILIRPLAQSLAQSFASAARHPLVPKSPSAPTAAISPPTRPQLAPISLNAQRSAQRPLYITGPQPSPEACELASSASFRLGRPHALGSPPQRTPRAAYRSGAPMQRRRGRRHRHRRHRRLRHPRPGACELSRDRRAGGGEGRPASANTDSL